MGSTRGKLRTALALAVVLLGPRLPAQMVTGAKIPGYAETMGTTPTNPAAFTVAYLPGSVPGNILWPGEQPRLTVQIANSTAAPLAATGCVEVIRYVTRGRPGDIWKPEMCRLAVESRIPVTFALAPNGWTNLTWWPSLPETKGGYALVLDLGPAGRRFVTSLVRTFRPAGRQPQYPQFCMDIDDPQVLTRLGVAPNRIAVSYRPTTEAGFERAYSNATARLREYREAHLPVTVEIGGGDFFHANQPLGRPRPHLDDRDVMKDTKFDLAWLPSYDADFGLFVRRLVAEFGWPRGPVNGIKLWNEPWEGMSISGWGADMLRYREMFRVLAEATRAACAEAGVEVLVGGCDSSSNTFDKLFGDGRDEWLEYLDFCSIHYQGMSPPSTVKAWLNRRHPNGRVRIWDTESWVANCDDRVAAVVAANLSTGHDRAVGVFGGNVVTMETVNYVEAETGRRQRARAPVAWPVAAAVGATVEFIGTRRFECLAFTNGLPWVMCFEGRRDAAGRPDSEDGTLVVVGDLGEGFGADWLLFRTARGIREKDAKQALFERLATLPGTAPERAALLEEFSTGRTLEGASLELRVPRRWFGWGDARFALYDFYGNPMPARDGVISVPLDGRGFFLRGNGRRGSFAALQRAVAQSRIQGIEPLAVTCHDLLAPVAARPELRLTLVNVLNRPVAGRLDVTLAGLTLEPAGQTVALAPHETRSVVLRVAGGGAAPNNIYPLALAFDAGADGRVRHVEDLHVNLIARRTVRVDGNLDDWAGVLPQVVRAPGSGAPTLTEAAWFPFERFATNTAQGYAEGFLACDATNFYFAARVADSTPHEGMLRFATRDEDASFYPATSYVARLPNSRVAPFVPSETAEPKALVWPADVRRFSYRERPPLPCGNAPAFDNVQLAFNVLPPAEKPWSACPPGTMPRYASWGSTDYEYALNPVAARYGGGTEIWRLQAPGMPHKHFYPRQPKSPRDGAVMDGQLAMLRDGNTRFVEAAIPWTEIPEVRDAWKAGRTVKLGFRVNDNTGTACLELARRRSVAKRSGTGAFTADWVEHWDNEIAFAFEQP